MQISFSDGYLLKALCEQTAEFIRSGMDRNELAAHLREFACNTRNKATGYWKLPQGKVQFLSAVEIMASLLEHNAKPAEFDMLYTEFTEVLSTVNPKCRVVFLAQEVSIWPSLEYVYNAMSADERFETRLVYVPFHHPNQQKEDHNLEEYSKMGYPVIAYDQYNLSEDNPDIVFFAKPYDMIPSQYTINEIDRIIPWTVYVPYGLETSYKLLRYGFQHFFHYKLWKHLVYGDFAKKTGAQYGYRNGENIEAWGYPRFDYYLKDCHSVIPNEWKEKINGRKVILWCPHHTIVPGPECVSTWLENYKTVFDFADSHPELFLLWRPHPLLFGAIVNNGYMTEAEMKAFVESKTNQDNIILDLTDDYHTAFDVSDAIITDGTTFSMEYLATGKPLMLTIDDIQNYYNSEEAEKGMYIGKTKEDIEQFMEFVLKGQDPKKNEREFYKNETLFIPKGQTISEYIENMLYERLKDDLRKTVRRIYHGKE